MPGRCTIYLLHEEVENVSMDGGRRYLLHEGEGECEHEERRQG